MGQAEREWMEEEVVFSRTVLEKADGALLAGLHDELNYIFNEAVRDHLRGTWRIVEGWWKTKDKMSRSEQRLLTKLRRLLHTLDKVYFMHCAGRDDEALKVCDEYYRRKRRR